MALATDEFIPTLSIILTVVVATGTMSYWLSNQFKDVRNLVYQKTEQLQNYFLAKVEAHEQHDDKRFDALNDDVWMIRLRLAANDMNGSGKKRKNRMVPSNEKGEK